MIRRIEKSGRLFSTIVVTLIALLLSQLVTFLVYEITKSEIPLSGRIASLASPMLITPFLTWWFFGLLLKISRLEKEMRELATYDVLTGVYNRSSFFAISTSVLSLLKREKMPLTVLYIDVDYFKKINDTFGHHVGDFVLNKIGNYIKESIRKSDIVGRIGGEEFVVALPKTDIEAGITIAEKIRHGISALEINHSDGVAIRVSVSIGISCGSENENIGIDQLLKNADLALYFAKANGRNRVFVNRNREKITC